MPTEAAATTASSIPWIGAGLVLIAVLVILTAKGLLRPLWRNRHGLLRVPWRLILFAVIAAAAFILLSLLLTPFKDQFEPPEEMTGFRDLSLPITIIGYLLIAVCVFAAGAVAARFFDRRSVASVGLGFHRGWAKELGCGLLMGALFITAIALVQIVTGVLRLEPSGVPPGVLLSQFFLYFVFFTGVALVEELLFRGYPLQALAEGIGKIPAAILLSAPFGITHYFNEGGTWVGALSTGFAGLLLTLAYFRTRSLWLPVGMHITWNMTMGWVFSTPVSGEVLPRTLFTSETSGPAWLSGGSFGPEGSVLAFAGMAVMAVIIYRSRRFDPSDEAAAWFPPPEVRVALEEGVSEDRDGDETAPL